MNPAPNDTRTPVPNNAGGHHNHSLFWTIMAPAGTGGGGEPTGKLADAIKRTFGEFAKLKEQLSTAPTTQFGSGWAGLAGAHGKLEVGGPPEPGNPPMDKKTPN